MKRMLLGFVKAMAMNLRACLLSCRQIRQEFIEGIHSKKWRC